MSLLELKHLSSEVEDLTSPRVIGSKTNEIAESSPQGGENHLQLLRKGGEFRRLCHKDIFERFHGCATLNEIRSTDNVGRTI